MKNEPAFPTRFLAGINDDGKPLGTFISTGMTLRDWYKGQALASGLCPPIFAASNPDKVAEWCGNQADAMIAERGSQ